MDMLNTLKDFMLTPAPSGYENEMAYKLVERLRPFAQEVRIDHVGNRDRQN